MKFARLGEPGAEVPVLLHGSRAYDLRGLTPDLSGTFLSRLDEVEEAFATGALPELVGAMSWRVGPPIAHPSAVYCIGMNYAAHAAETGSEPPEDIVVFMKPPNTLAGPNDDLPIPPGSTRTDWEVELAVVIGTPAYRVGSPAEAESHIAGFALANDVSEREWQIDLSGGQWSKGKSAPGFLPLGPWLVTPDDFDPSDVTLTSRVNGARRQASRTTDMIVNVAGIVHELSRFVRLDPGDVILTGTPEGVALSGRFPYLTAGDEVQVAIEGLGRQRQKCVAS